MSFPWLEALSWQNRNNDNRDNNFHLSLSHSLGLPANWINCNDLLRTFSPLLGAANVRRVTLAGLCKTGK